MAPQGTYQLGRQIGKGGFATVFEGVGGPSGSDLVAIKVVQSSSMKPSHSAKFLAELIIHSKLQHANIVQFHEAYPNLKDDTTHMVLELCPNGSLKEMQAKRDILSYPELRRFGIQICGALHFLHSKCIVHRDLKLQNILLDQQMNVKLADFGLVGLLKSDDDKDVIKRLTLCGTPNYMAPEMWARQGHDQRLDIWALGAVLFYLAVGWAPFSRAGDRNIQAIKERASKTDIQWPDDSALCEPLRELLEIMMHPEEEHRPSCTEVVEHSFFSMRGGIPRRLETECRDKAPTWINGKKKEMWAYAPKVSSDELITECGMKVKSNKSIIKEIEREEIARLAPTLPLKSTYKPKAVAKPLSDITNKPKRTKSRPQLGLISCISPSDPVELVQDVPLSVMCNTIRHMLKATEDLTLFNPFSVMPAPTISSPPPLVYNWFTHKLGFGYMLVNGDIGAMLADTPSAFLVQAANPDCVSFFAKNASTQGYERLVQSIASKSSDPYDKHAVQRETATKVCHAFVRHLNKKRGDMPQPLASDPAATAPAFIRAFCRVGSSQVFVFGAGGLQFNFPDRTKLLVSPDGTFVSFYYLPLDIAQMVSRKEVVTDEIDHDLVMHMPLSLLLGASATMNQPVYEILEANEFRQKIEFIKELLRIWDANGGPGRGREKLDWSGMHWIREEPKEPTWGYFDI